eukprot:scaffold118072_cov58-Attheya_sp.AAC.4
MSQIRALRNLANACCRMTALRLTRLPKNWVLAVITGHGIWHYCIASAIASQIAVNREKRG